MKVNFGQEPYTVSLNTLLVGSCFMCDRTKGQGKGIYMVVDKNNGIISSLFTKDKIIAINLESGQLRPFLTYQQVEPINAEVSINK